MASAELPSESEIILQTEGFENIKKNITCRVGTIDIGTNSTHLLIATIDPHLNTFSIDIAEKSTTRLGEKDPQSGDLTSISMNRAFETLKRFKEIALSYKVKNLSVAATSAVREAPNGKSFLATIKETIGLDVDLISGTEEARLIYLGVLSGMPFGENPHLVLDIGGGSTELILADSKDARALTSTKIGAVRLQNEFLKQEPLTPERYNFLRAFVRGLMEPAVKKTLKRIKQDESPVMVATSGTAMAIGTLIASQDDSSQSKLHGYILSKSNLDKVVAELCLMTPEQRRSISILSDRRAEIIVPGALILQTVMEMVGLDELVLSERALREGLVVDWMCRNGYLQDRLSFQGSIRQRTVLHQVRRFGVNSQRSQKVSEFAMTFYDKTKGILHEDKGLGRELLWAASMLYSCGQHININSYHKHSWYLIRHGELLGYSQSEHLMVAAIARYHRKSFPKKRHDSWQSLISNDHKNLVFDMSILLRLSSAINKRPEPLISSLVVTVNPNLNEISIELIPEKLGQNIDLEKWSLNKTISSIRKVKQINFNVI